MASNSNRSGASNANGGGFRAKLEYYMNSGEKKHVFAGIAIVAAVAGIPWYYMTRGTNLFSHKEYYVGGRKERLSTDPSAKK